jgi:flagellar motor switch protein FliN/FliY
MKNDVKQQAVLADLNKNTVYEEAFSIIIKELEDFVEVPIHVNVLLGQRQVKIRDLLNFAPGYLLDLKRSAGESLLVFLEDVFFAKGEVTIIEDTFGVRITEIHDPRKV